MNNLYPCSFKCLKSVAVMVCVWLPPFLFSGYSFTLAYCYKQLVFLVSLAHFPFFIDSIFLSTAFSIHIAKKTYFLLRSGFWNIF